MKPKLVLPDYICIIDSIKALKDVTLEEEDDSNKK